jgi:hypothetical protein
VGVFDQIEEFDLLKSTLDSVKKETLKATGWTVPSLKLTTSWVIFSSSQEFGEYWFMRFFLGLCFQCRCLRFHNNEFGATVMTKLVFIRECLVAAA